MTASLTKTTSFVASDWEEITASGNNATLPATRTSKHLWIRQTLETTDDSVTPTLTEMVLEVNTDLIEQFSFQFFEDDANPNSATSLATENTNINLNAGNKFRLRLGVVKE
jgi:hypothetical protein